MKYKNKVFKVIDDVNVKIDQDGNVSTDSYINWMTGGWKDLNWLAERQKSNDNGWNALFKAAKNI